MNLPTEQSEVNKKMFLRTWRVKHHAGHVRYLGHCVQPSTDCSGYIVDGVYFPVDVFMLPLDATVEMIEVGLTKARRMGVRS